MIDRLRRVTDLFVEGRECYLGMDEGNKPVIIWVNKLNSFETEEARRDGMVRRGQRIMELSKEDNPEFVQLQATVHRWSDRELAERRVDQKSEEIYLEVVNELQSEESWAEKLAIMRRMPDLLRDSKAPDSDPRYAEVEDLNSQYLNEVRERQAAKQEQALREFEGADRAEMESEFFEAWRERVSLDEFMQERRITEMFYAMRDCVATEKGRDSVTNRVLFDHTNCNHAERLLQERKQVRELPEYLLNQVIDLIDDITVPQRESGNSDAPASSSASSEPRNEEADSTASTPEEVSPAVPTISAQQ
jgi:hypothetical protein